ncbi:hypothetical protein KY284_005112 [Solanum tuberosum]|nr:hypothetical protein KY284_005112 [Solanum tuberosum]
MVPSASDQFDWEGDLPLKFPQRDLVIYETHVRGFTNHESSETKYPGTYLGVVEKLDHLKVNTWLEFHVLQELGVNCIELMPCHEFNELEYYSYNSVLGDYKSLLLCGLCFAASLIALWQNQSRFNFWGYSTVNFFSPMGSAGLSNCGLGAITEFKYLVKEAHKHGIKVTDYWRKLRVIMDVVFNHTAEGNENGPILSFRGIDNSVFYMLAPKFVANPCTF